MRFFVPILGLLSPLTIILWSSLVSMGMLTFALLWGWLGISGFAAANVSIAYMLNKARKHSRPGAFDDRLTTERMEAAREWLLSRDRTS